MTPNIYLDFNASTPLAPEVVATITPLLTKAYGNPSSAHWAGIPAKEALETARVKVADLLGCQPNEIVFTSGGTESNNLALVGTFFAVRGRGNHIITSTIEHPAVRRPIEFLQQLGAEVSVVPVDGEGRVDPAAVEHAITPKTILISIMHANNEVGTIQPIREIASIGHAAGVVVHTDAAQSTGKVPTRVDDLGVDLLSIAGHKLYAPKGIGALYVRDGTSLEPFMHGAGHERGRRAGTENVMLAAGLGVACELGQHWVQDTSVRILRDRFEQALVTTFGSAVSINGASAPRLPNTSNVNFIGRQGSEVLQRLDGVAASTGSACHAGSLSISPVLAAMGVDPNAAVGAVRFSLGRTTTWEELQAVLDALKLVLDSEPLERTLAEHWNAVFRSTAPESLTWYERRAEISIALIQKAAHNRASGIIDIGGGNSLLVDELLKLGYSRISVLDVAEQAIDAARTRLGATAGQVQWIVEDVTQWDSTNRFEVWHDRATFHFLTEADQRAAYRHALERSVLPGGQVIMGVFALNAPAQCSGLPVVRYEPVSLSRELGQQFELLEAALHQHQTPHGDALPFLYCRFARRT